MHYQIHRTSGPGSRALTNKKDCVSEASGGHHMHAKIVIIIKRDTQNPTRASTRIKRAIKLTIN
jgi:hypothetical protein